MATATLTPLQADIWNMVAAEKSEDVLKDLKKTITRFFTRKRKAAAEPVPVYSKAEILEMALQADKERQEGRCYRMRDGETTDEFIDRLLCIG